MGNIRITIDESSNVVSARDYYAYGGELRGYTSGIEDKYQFTEKERDSETGLDYYGARYFNSDEGR